jgi:hypothetical protein
MNKFNTKNGIIIKKGKVISSNVDIEISYTNNPVNINSCKIGYYIKRGIYVHTNVSGKLLTNKNSTNNKVLGILSNKNDPFYLCWGTPE